LPINATTLAKTLSGSSPPHALLALRYSAPHHSLAHLRGLPALRGENQAHALRFTIHACPDSFARSFLSAFVMKSSSRITRKYPETPTLQHQLKQEISGYMKKYPEISGYKSKHVLYPEISGNFFIAERPHLTGTTNARTTFPSHLLGVGLNLKSSERKLEDLVIPDAKGPSLPKRG
jgi:hypothetical protein